MVLVRVRVMLGPMIPFCQRERACAERALMERVRVRVRVRARVRVGVRWVGQDPSGASWGTDWVEIRVMVTHSP